MKSSLGPPLTYFSTDLTTQQPWLNSFLKTNERNKQSKLVIRLRGGPRDIWIRNLCSWFINCYAIHISSQAITTLNDLLITPFKKEEELFNDS